MEVEEYLEKKAYQLAKWITINSNLLYGNISKELVKSVYMIFFKFWLMLQDELMLPQLRHARDTGKI